MQTIRTESTSTIDDEAWTFNELLAPKLNENISDPKELVANRVEILKERMPDEVKQAVSFVINGLFFNLNRSCYVDNAVASIQDLRSIKLGTSLDIIPDNFIRPNNFWTTHKHFSSDELELLILESLNNSETQVNFISRVKTFIKLMEHIKEKCKELEAELPIGLVKECSSFVNSIFRVNHVNTNPVVDISEIQIASGIPKKYFLFPIIDDLPIINRQGLKLSLMEAAISFANDDPSNYIQSELGLRAIANLGKNGFICTRGKKVWAEIFRKLIEHFGVGINEEQLLIAHRYLRDVDIFRYYPHTTTELKRIWLVVIANIIGDIKPENSNQPIDLEKLYAYINSGGSCAGFS